MQAQTWKDQAEDSQTQGAPQRSVTDWLMQVISGKPLPSVTPKPEVPEPPSSSASVPLQEAVADPPPATEAIPLPSSFAQDLHGAPSATTAVAAEPEATVAAEPQASIAAEPEAAAANDVNADDLCRVPVEDRVRAEVAPTPVDVFAQPDVFSQPDVSAESNVSAEPNFLAEPLDIFKDPVPQFTAEPETLSASTPEHASIFLHHAFTAAFEPEAAAIEVQPAPEPTPSIDIAPPQQEFASTAPEQAESFEHVAAVPTLASSPAPEHEEPAPAEEALSAQTEEVQPVSVEEAQPVAIEEVLPASEAEPVAPEAEPVTPVAVETPAAVAQTIAAPEPETRANVWAKQDFWDEEKHSAVGEVQPRQPEQPHAAPRPIPGVLGSFLEPEEIAAIHNAQPTGWSASWRTLIRLGAALPWLSRALPSLEAGFGSQENAMLAPQMKHEVEGIRQVQYEMRTAVQEHSTQLKRVEAQLALVQETIDLKSSDEEMAEKIQSAIKMLKTVGIGLGALLIVLIVLALMLVAKK